MVDASGLGLFSLTPRCLVFYPDKEAQNRHHIIRRRPPDPQSQDLLEPIQVRPAKQTISLDAPVPKPFIPIES